MAFNLEAGLAILQNEIARQPEKAVPIVAASGVFLLNSNDQVLPSAKCEEACAFEIDAPR
jgi:hypothetical protein